MPETEAPRLPFGYNQGLPEKITAAWGCRAILEKDHLDILRDRQGAIGSEEEKKVLYEKVNEILPALRVVIKKLYEEGKIDAGIGNENETQFQNGLTVKMNTNGSHGYLYICAYVPSKEK